MKDTRVSKRYAKALFEVARRDGILDAVAADLTLVERFLAEIPYLRAVLIQPLVSEDRKYKVAGDAFGDRVTATTLHFLMLLIRKKREDLIDLCIADFRALAAELANTMDAVAYTATPLSATQLQAMAASLARLTGKKVQLTSEIDPDIIGGTVVRMGDTVIDGSVRGRLEKLRQCLLGGSAA